LEPRKLDFAVLRKPGEYVQDEVLTSDRPAKLLYIADKNKLAVVCSIEDLEVVKTMPGRTWDKTWRAWVVPMEYQAYVDAKARFKNLSLAPNVERWVKNVEKRRAELIDLKHLEDVEIDAPNADKLYPYQRVGVNFIKQSKIVLLADDMGTGKTFQTMLALESMGCERILVIAPKKPCKSWKDEQKKWLPDKPLTHLSGTSQRKDKLISEFQGGFMVMTYETSVLKQEQLMQIPWDAVVLDEGHKIKNRKTPRTVAVKRYNYIPIRIVMTGSPVLGNATKAAQELWSILNFLYPDKFSNYWRFVDQHYVMHEGEIVGLRNPEEFRAMLAPVMIRRLKADVLQDLPEKTFMTEHIELYPAERKVLKQLAKEMEAELSNGEFVIAPLVISQITRMRQCCISSRLLSKNLKESNAEYKSAKLEAMLELIQDNQEGHKIVVFSQFEQALQLAAEALRKAGIKYTALTGKMSDKQSDASLDRFREDPNCRVMLATITAGGVGVDGMQVADIAIFLDRDWTPGINAQAEDRLLRIGQKNAVTIIKLVAENSVEGYIEKMLADKAEIFDDWINETAKIKVKDIRRYLMGVVTAA
jgi:SNF2 family DNA or RNA helicase